jgi:hypothetical protein
VDSNHSTQGKKVVGRSADAGRSKNAEAANFRIRSLSDAETERVETACASQKAAGDADVYADCIKTQLDGITGVAGPADLSGLSETERESIESACAREKHLQATAGYDRCLKAQLREFAAEPARPDLSGVSDADRASIEISCGVAKTEGPAAYDRCRSRFVKLLAESR